ncbi:MAG: hypothetical protein KGL53_12815 [Elusimicrobia bacterium]|nr:hypothetical protein [Elusimicrobiota bacterium]
MRGLSALGVLLLAACAAPRPCTRALCPLPAPEASYRVDGWSGSVTVAPGDPPVPIVSDARVEVLSGNAEFANGASRVSAPAGSAFRFEVSTGTLTPIIEVSSGSVEVRLSSAAAAETVPAGASYSLPVPK